MTPKELIAAYVAVKIELEANKGRETELRLQVANFFAENNGAVPDVDGGKFSWKPQKSWTYPQHVVEMEADINVRLAEIDAEMRDDVTALKSAKEESQRNGDADCLEKPGFSFTVDKVVE